MFPQNRFSLITVYCLDFYLFFKLSAIELIQGKEKDIKLRNNLTAKIFYFTVYFTIYSSN